MAQFKQQLEQLVQQDQSCAQPVVRHINVPGVLYRAQQYLIRQAQAPAGQPVPFMVAIAGGTASGKTVLTQQLSDALKKHGPNNQSAQASSETVPVVQALSLDDYYKDTSTLRKQLGEERYFQSVNLDTPDAFHLREASEHLTRLRQGKPIKAPVYEFMSSSSHPGKRVILPAQFVLKEGLFAYASGTPLAGFPYDLTVYVYCPPDSRKTRWWERAQTRYGAPDKAHANFQKAFDQHCNVVAPQAGKALIILNGHTDSHHRQPFVDSLTKLLFSLKQEPAAS